MNIDFSHPQWLIIYYHVMGVISIILNFFGIYLLLIHCKNLAKFRYFLLGYQIICLVTDIHLNFLWQPVPLYPILAGYSVGYLANWIPFHYSMLIISVLAIFQLNFLLICFMKRHQAVALVLENHIFPKNLTKSFYIFSFIFPIIFGALFETLKLTKDEQWDYITKTYPEHFSSFQTLLNFSIYNYSPLFYIMCTNTIIGGVTVISSLFLMIIDIFRMMRKLKIRISLQNYRKHKEALRSLLVQLGAAYFCVFPACFLIIVVSFEVPRVQLLAELMIACLAAHSSVNMTSLMLFFPPYRKFFKDLYEIFQEATAGGGPTSTVATSKRRHFRL